MNLQVAIALHMQAQYSQAKTIYQNILTIEPRNADALHLLVVVAYQTEDYLEAVELIEKAIHINPSVANFHSNLGLALQDLKQFNQAIACYDNAIKLKPDFP